MRNRKKLNTGLLENVASALDLPKGALGICPVVSITGRGELRLEGHSAIISYEENRLMLGTDDFILVIKGKSLSIERIADGFIDIKGIILGVEYNAYS